MFYEYHNGLTEGYYTNWAEARPFRNDRNTERCLVWTKRGYVFFFFFFFFILFYFILFYFILFYFILFYFFVWVLLWVLLLSCYWTKKGEKNDKKCEKTLLTFIITINNIIILFYFIYNRYIDTNCWTDTRSVIFEYGTDPQVYEKKAEEEVVEEEVKAEVEEPKKEEL